MARKEEVTKEAEELGIEVPSNATIADIEELIDAELGKEPDVEESEPEDEAEDTEEYINDTNVKQEAFGSMVSPGQKVAINTSASELSLKKFSRAVEFGFFVKA